MKVFELTTLFNELLIICNTDIESAYTEKTHGYTRWIVVGRSGHVYSVTEKSWNEVAEYLRSYEETRNMGIR